MWYECLSITLHVTFGLPPPPHSILPLTTSHDTTILFVWQRCKERAVILPL